MQFGRVVVAWVVVVAWFALATVLIGHLVARLSSRAAESFLVARRLVEATLLTLIASLWFDSLGSGEWWLLFLLIGALATLASWFRFSPGVPKKLVIVEGIAELARYVVAGGLLAWRLS